MDIIAGYDVNNVATNGGIFEYFESSGPVDDGMGGVSFSFDIMRSGMSFRQLQDTDASGIALGDFDNDGDIDVITATLTRSEQNCGGTSGAAPGGSAPHLTLHAPL